jgi:hypothetical protein
MSARPSIPLLTKLPSWAMALPKAIDLAHDATSKVEDTARRDRQTAQRTADAVGEMRREVVHLSEGTAEFGQALVGLLKEQNPVIRKFGQPSTFLECVNSSIPLFGEYDGDEAHSRGRR